MSKKHSLYLMRLRLLTGLVCILNTCPPSVVWGQTLEEILNKRSAKTLQRSPETQEMWKQMLAAFVSNDLEKAKALADKFLSQQQVLTPLQIRATQMLLELSANASTKGESTEVAQLKIDATEVLRAAQFAEGQLARVEAQMIQMPKQFTAGGPTHQKWIHLNNEQQGYTANRDAAKKKYDGLKAKYDDLMAGKTKVVEEGVIALATALSDENQIDGAMALCTIFIRKHPPAEETVKKGQELVLLKDAYDRASQLLVVVEASVRKLLADKKVWGAQAELVKTKGLIESKIEDSKEKSFFAGLIKPLEEEVRSLIEQIAKKTNDVRRLSKTDPTEAQKQFIALHAEAGDNPELSNVGAEIKQKDKQVEAGGHDKVEEAVLELAKTDLNAAKKLLGELGTSLPASKLPILKARLDGAGRGGWLSEFDAMRADIDEAHTFLEQVSSNFLFKLKNGDDEEIRASLREYEARENMTRAKGLLSGALKSAETVPLNEIDKVLIARIEGIKATAMASLAEIERAEHLIEDGRDSGGQMMGIYVFAAVLGIGALVFFVRKKLAH